MTNRSNWPYPEETEYKPILAVCGDTGLDRNVGLVDEEFHTDLKGKKAIKKYREMADNDPILGSGLWLYESLIRSVVWSIEVNDSGHPLAPFVADRIDEAFNDMEATWDQILANFASAFMFGWAYLEPTYKIRRGKNPSKYFKSKHDDGFYGWRDWGIRAAESLDRWAFDEEGRTIGMWQRPPHDYRTRFVPIDRALHYRLRARKNNPEGYSLLRITYPSYYYAKRLREIEAIGMERNVAGLPVMQLPPEIMHSDATSTEKSVRSQYEKMVQKVRFDHYSGLVIPSEQVGDRNTGYKFGLVSASGKNFADVNTTIIRYEKNMAICFFDQFKLLGQEGVGSYAMHSDQTNLLGVVLNGINKGIADIVNDIAIPRLCDLNGWPVDTYPRYIPGDLEKQKLVEAGQFISSMISSGAMEATPDVNDWARKMIDLPPSEARIDEGSVTAEELAVQQAEEVPIEAAEDEEIKELDGLAESPNITVEELMAITGLSRNSIINAIKRGQIPGVKVGNKFIMVREKIMNLIENGGFE